MALHVGRLFVWTLDEPLVLYVLVSNRTKQTPGQFKQDKNTISQSRKNLRTGSKQTDFAEFVVGYELLVDSRRAGYTN